MANRIMTAGNFKKNYSFDGVNDYIDYGNGSTDGSSNQNSDGTAFSLKYDSSNYWVAQGFKISSNDTLAGLQVCLEKQGSLSGNVYVEIQTDDGTGKPSGTVVTNGTSKTVDASNIPAEKHYTYFIFSTVPSLSINTQ